VASGRHSILPSKQGWKNSPLTRPKRTGDYSAGFSGQTEIDGIPFIYKVKAAIEPDASSASFTPSWKVEKDIENWEVSVAYQKDFPGE
jgi:hypothetical protein